VDSIDEAISILENWTQYDDSEARISVKLEHFQAEKGDLLEEVRQLVEESERLASRGDRPRALIALEKAHLKHPTDENLKRKRNTLHNSIERIRTRILMKSTNP